MRGRPAAELLRLPVRLRGIQLGRPVDLLVDVPSRRVLGLDVLCGDDVHRFLPMPAVTIREDELAVSSALTMLDESELGFYRARASALSELGLEDILVGPDGTIEDFIVADDGAAA